MLKSNNLIFSVDDSALSRKTLEAACRSVGYEIRSFETAQEALNAARIEKPALVMTDIVMPGMSGMDLLAAFLADERIARIPVIMITAGTDLALVEKTLDAGAFDFIRKPYEEGEILARIRSALRWAELTQQLLHAAQHDSLTGLFNHASLMQELSLALAESLSERQPLSFLMIDIDYFKKVNDTFGHQTGDSVLREVSTLIQKAFPSAICGRYGGEEFAVILPHYDKDMTFRMAEAFRAMVASKSFPGIPHQITISIGYHSIEGNGSVCAPQLVVKHADEALYEAKNQGRNRTVYSQKK